MTDLPVGWEARRLDEIADVRLGRQRSPKNHTGDQMRPYLRAANVDWGGLKLDDVKEMNFTDTELETYRLEPGDIVLSEASGSPSEVGKPALWTGEIADCAIQNTLIRVRAHGPEPRYLLHYFWHLARSGAFADESRGVGIHHIGRAKLAEWRVPVAPLDEQRRIVAILEDHLSRLDAAESGLISAGKRSAAMRRKAMAQLLDSDYPRMRLKETLEVSIGGIWGDPPGESELEVNVLRVTELREGGVVDPATAASRSCRESQYRSRALQQGDLLLEKSGGGPTTPVGRVGLVPTLREPSVCSNFMQLMRPDSSKVLPRYLHLYLNGFHVSGRTAGMQTASTNIRNIKASEYMEIEVAVPDLQTQKRLVDEVEAMIDSCSALEAEIRRSGTRLRSLRRAVLAAAFSGNLPAAGQVGLEGMAHV